MAHTSPLSSVRIIGGKWRRRRLYFPVLPGLRPTHDRIRETVFNWLIPYLEGASCLDLFAGSGALGFEALSRGAKQVTLVDNTPQLVQALKKNAASLNANPIEIVQAQCPTHVPPLQFSPFDIVFLDPPFHQGLVLPAIQWLQQQAYLVDLALVYVETEQGADPPLPSHWQCLRAQKTASLTYSLWQSQTSKN